MDDLPRTLVSQQHDVDHVLEKDAHHPSDARQLHVVVEVEPVLGRSDVVLGDAQPREGLLHAGKLKLPLSLVEPAEFQKLKHRPAHLA